MPKFLIIAKDTRLFEATIEAENSEDAWELALDLESWEETPGEGSFTLEDVIEQESE